MFWIAMARMTNRLRPARSEAKGPPHKTCVRKHQLPDCCEKDNAASEPCDDGKPGSFVGGREQQTGNRGYSHYARREPEQKGRKPGCPLLSKHEHGDCAEASRQSGTDSGC